MMKKKVSPKRLAHHLKMLLHLTQARAQRFHRLSKRRGAKVQSTRFSLKGALRRYSQEVQSKDACHRRVERHRKSILVNSRWRHALRCLRALDLSSRDGTRVV